MNKRKTAYWLSEGEASEYCPYCQAELRYSGPRNPGLRFRCPDCERWVTIVQVGIEEVTETTAPLCDRCNAPMVRRTGKYGEFWGCSQWSKTKCRGKTGPQGRVVTWRPVCELGKWQPYTDPHPEWREDWERGEELREQWEAEEARKKALRRQRLDQKSFEW